jgi:hypothetical protein
MGFHQIAYALGRSDGAFSLASREKLRWGNRLVAHWVAGKNIELGKYPCIINPVA